MASRHKFNLALISTIAVLVNEAQEELFRYLLSRNLPRVRTGSIFRVRSKFTTVTENLTNEEFKCAFRMRRRTFLILLERLKPHLLRDAKQGRCSSGGVIQPAVRLAMTLRMLAGGSYHDQMMCWRVGRSVTFKVFLETLKAIRIELEMPGIPFNDETELESVANKFQLSRGRPNPLYGCVGALDGIAIAIKRPPDEFMPRNFYCRKGMYAFPVQAVVDSELRFRYMSCRCSGSTHDAAAFDVSDLASKLKTGQLKAGYWIAGDAAYVSIPGLLTPWSKSELSGENGIYADSFNFYHSSHRIHVEQAFGVLVQRWGILWKPLQYHINESLTIVSSAMRLHNFCVEHDGRLEVEQQIVDKEMSTEAYRTWWKSATSLRTAIAVNQGTRRDLESNELRESLTSNLKSRGITRPAMC